MSFMRFKLVKNKEKRKRLRKKSVFIDGVCSFAKKYFDHAFDSIDVDDVIIIINHES